MPTYEIEQYELHAQTFHVAADSPAQAIIKLWAGQAAAVDNTLELIAIPADEFGLSVDDNPELAAELWRLEAIRGAADCIPGIRSVELIDEDEENAD